MASTDEELIVRPKYRRAILGHEKGAGAKCLKCGPKCEGLDLHFWRKTCKNCRCKLEDHEVKLDEDEVHHKILQNLFVKRHDNSKVEKDLKDLSLNGRPAENTQSVAEHFIQVPEGSTAAAEEADYVLENMISSVTHDRRSQPMSWTAVGLLKIKKYMNALPKEKAAHVSEDGKKYRQKQLLQQLPAHDFDEAYCDDLSEQERATMEEFSRKRNEEAVGQGAIKESHENNTDSAWSCHRCGDAMKGGEVAIFAEKAGPEKCWHPQCFVCSTCQEMLVDLIYFFKDDKIYCGRHYGELTRVRCAACDELIFSREYTQAEGRNWHIKHFCCFECDAELGGQKYVAKDKHPFCMDCYGKKFAKICHHCKERIAADQKRVGYKDFFWHARDECFNCSACSKPLSGKQFIIKEQSVFCSVECARGQK